MQIISNPYDTLLFRIYGAASAQSIAEYHLFGKSIDTTLGTRYLPLSNNVFEYSVRTSGLFDSASRYLRITEDTLNFGNVDSAFISKNSILPMKFHLNHTDRSSANIKKE